MTENQPNSSKKVSDMGQTPLRKFFEAAIKHQASDILIKPKAQVKLRLRGALKSLESKPFSIEEFENIIDQFLNDDQKEHYKKYGAVDLAYDYDEDNRFRVNVFRTRGRSALAARRVSSKILSYDELYLPPILKQIASARDGLVLLCGGTGSGKSTTIASMLQQINVERACHILTLEDPIEFIFKDAKAMVNQREIGMDVPDYVEGIRVLVRENPDVVLIGELRDHVTFKAAIQAAETGHLVFGTIHASSAPLVFGRIYNLFPQEERDLIRDMFSQNLVAIVYQKLLESLLDEPPYVPAMEILLNNPIVKKYILEKREIELGEIIRKSREEGMMDFTSSLVELVEKEYIHPRVAMANAFNSDEVKMRLKGISTK